MEMDYLPGHTEGVKTAHPQGCRQTGVALLASGKMPPMKVDSLAFLLLWVPLIEQLSLCQGQYHVSSPDQPPEAGMGPLKR